MLRIYLTSKRQIVYILFDALHIYSRPLPSRSLFKSVTPVAWYCICGSFLRIKNKLIFILMFLFLFSILQTCSVLIFRSHNISSLNLFILLFAIFFIFAMYLSSQRLKNKKSKKKYEKKEKNEKETQSYGNLEVMNFF